jgi:hypothetical protein
MSPPPLPTWSIEIKSTGRSGTVEYREEAGSLSFYWEFGGGDAVASISVGDLAKWTAAYPWAIDRRREILERVAQEVIRQKAPNCRADIDDAGGYIDIRENAT